MLLDVVHDNSLHILGEEIANRPLHQIGLLEHAGGASLFGNPLLNGLPFFDQQRHIAHEIRRPLALAHSADDDPHPVGNRKAAQNLLQPRAFFMVFNFARNAALVGVRQQHQITPRQGQVRGHARPLGADRPFGDLDDDVASRRIKARDVLLRNLWAITAAAFALDEFNPAVKRGRHDVPIMQEGVLLEADVHEGGFQPVFQIADLAFVDAADQAVVIAAFDREFLQAAIFNDRHPGFQRLGVDDHFFVDLLLRFDHPLHALDDFLGRGLDGLDDAFRLRLDRHGLKLRSLFLHFGRNREIRLAERPAALLGGSGLLGHHLGGLLVGEAGRFVFGPFDFALVPVGVKDVVILDLLAFENVGPGLCRSLFVGVWRRVRVHSAVGPEAMRLAPS